MQTFSDINKAHPKGQALEVVILIQSLSNGTNAVQFYALAASEAFCERQHVFKDTVGVDVVVGLDVSECIAEYLSTVPVGILISCNLVSLHNLLVLVGQWLAALLPFRNPNRLFGHLLHLRSQEKTLQEN